MKADRTAGINRLSLLTNYKSEQPSARGQQAEPRPWLVSSLSRRRVQVSRHFICEQSCSQKHPESVSPPTALKNSKSSKKVKRFTDVQGLPCIERMVSSVEETPEPICTDIVGQIPEWIDGNFLRNGPGKFEIGNQKWVNLALLCWSQSWFLYACMSVLYQVQPLVRRYGPPAPVQNSQRSGDLQKPLPLQ